MDRKKYKGKLVAIKDLSVKPKFQEDADCVSECKNLLKNLFDTMLEQPQDYGIRWMFGLERYIKDKQRKINHPFKKHLTRGHIVEVELYGHFNRELTFLHPAVVLYDNHNGQVLIAPISTTKFGSKNPLHISIDENDGVQHSSGICLDSLRIIDKLRILYQHTIKSPLNEIPAKVRPEKLDEIDTAIMKQFLPKTYKRNLDIQHALEPEIKEHNALKQKYIDLERKYDQLSELIKNDEVASSKL